MHIPENYTEQQVVEIVNKVAKKLAGKFRFGYHQLNDIVQEAWIIAIKLLDAQKYDGKRPLENFLYVHIHNRLYNFKRDNYARPDKPCNSCEFIGDFDSCTKFDDVQDCVTCMNWLTRNMKKKNLMHPLDIGNIRDEKEDGMRTKSNVTQAAASSEYYDILGSLIPSGVRRDYLKWKNGVRITKSKRIKLFNIMQKIVEDYGTTQRSNNSKTDR